MSRIRCSLAIVSISTCLVACPRAKEIPKIEAVKLENDTQKAAYAMGYQLGTQLRPQETELDAAALALGINDGMNGKPLPLSEAENRKLISEWQRAAGEKSRAAATEKARILAEKGRAFLEENKKKEGVVVLSNGVQYKVIKEGTGPKPKTGDVVVAHFREILFDGTEVDSSISRGTPAKIPLGSVEAGWIQVLRLMNTGSKWQVFVPAELSTPPARSGPQLGPRTTYVLEIEIVGVENPTPTPANLPKK